MGLEHKMKVAFDCIGADEGLRASTKDYLRDIRGQENRGRQICAKRARPFRQTMRLACALLTVFLCVSGYALFWVPVSYVSIDVNPSLELALNRLDRVIYAKAYNEDGERIAASVSVRGMRYGDAIDSVVGSEAMQSYLTRDGDLIFTIAAVSGQKEEQLISDISNSSGCLAHGGISVRGDINTVGEAHGNGFSLGKYTAYQLLLKYDDSVTMQDCHDMSMSQIQGLIEEHAHGPGYDSGSDGHGHHCGSGHG